jgi:hypothetical protein
MISPSESFIVVEYCPDILAASGEEIAIVIFGQSLTTAPRLHKLVAWREIATGLPAEEVTMIAEILNDITARLRSSRHYLKELLQFENVIRIRGPWSADLFAEYASKILR